MSLILDALKKSETERQQQGSTEFATVPSADTSSPPPRWLWVLGALLVVNAVVVAGLLLRPGPAVGPATTSIAPPAEAQNEAPATDSGTFAEQIATARASQSEATPAVEPDASAMNSPQPDAAADTLQAPVDTNEVATLAEPVETDASPTLALPTLDQLRAGGILALPDLHLDIHVYSETPADRFVFVNMTKHREASRLQSGPVVEEITPEGVVLTYQGTRFLLPRE